MANRQFIQGFETGLTGINSPTDGNITVQSVIKRTGNYALHCNIPTNTKSTLNLGLHFQASSGYPATFFRAYVYLVAAPASGSRVIFQNSTFAGIDVSQLAIDSNRRILIQNNFVTKSTCTTQLTLNTWYCIEWGVNNQQRYSSVRINGVPELDWTSYSTTAPVGNTIYATDLLVGGLETTGSAIEYYLDDIAFDSEQWCNPGKVVGLLPNHISDSETDNANWTVTGAASKALALRSFDDDTSYIQSGSVSGATSRILFDIEDLPSNATQVRGYTVWTRARRGVSGSGSAILPSRKMFGTYEDFGALSTNFFGGTNAYATAKVGCNSWTPKGWAATPNNFNATDWGFYNLDANSYIVSGYMVEADYTDDDSELLHSKREFIASCDTGDTSEWTTIVGTTAASTTHVRNGTYSIKTSAAAASSSYLQHLVTGDSFSQAPMKTFYGRAYIYIETLPTTGQVQIFDFSNGVNEYMGFALNSAGKIALTTWGAFNRTTLQSYSAASVPTGQWVNIEWFHQASSSSTSANGVAQVIVNNVVYASSSTQQDSGSVTYTGLTLNLGVITNGSSTGSCSIYWDDVVLDYGSRIGESKVKALFPTAIGTYTGGPFTPTGGTLLTSVQDKPADDDATYITSTAGSPTALDSTSAISYTVDQLPVSATIVPGISLHARMKLTSSGTYTAANTFRINNINWPLNAQYILTGGAANTAWSTFYKVFAAGMQGAFSPSQVNGMELVNYIGPNASWKMTQNFAAVEYAETNTGRYEVNANAMLKGTTTKEVACDAFVDPGVITRTKEATADGLIKSTKTSEVASNALVQATNAFTVATDGVVKAVQTTNLDADGYLINLTIGQYEVAVDGVLKGTRQLELDAAAILQTTTMQTLQADAVMQQTTTSFVTADALLGIITHPTKEVAANALIQETKTLELDGSGVLLQTLTQEVQSNAIVQDLSALVLDADGVLQGTAALELEADADLLETIFTETDADADILATEAYETFSDAILQDTSFFDVLTDANLQDTKSVEVAADDYLIFIWELDVATDAILFNPNVTKDVSADAYCPGIDGILRATLFAANRINAIPFVLGSTSGGYLNFVYPHPQDRDARRLQSKRIALLDLSLDGTLIEAIGADDIIAYTIYHEDGTVFIPTQPASWYIVYYDEINQPVYGWTDMIVASNLTETLKIVWTIEVNGVANTFIDQVRVK